MGFNPAHCLSLAGVVVMPVPLLNVVSTPLKKCIGTPEQKYISDAGKKAPELGAFSSGIRLGWDYPPAGPSWPGVSGACSD
jgi:hypothetical protein